MNTHQIESHTTNPEWTPETITDFWNYWSQRTDCDKWYFSNTQGKKIIDFAKGYGIFDGDILDYGCARGFLVEHLLSEKRGQVHALDFSDDSVARVNQQYSGRSNWQGAITVGDLPSSYQDNQFDLVFCIEVVEHLLDEWYFPTLDELFRVTKPGGHVIISTPYQENLLKETGYCPFCKSAFHKVQHLRSFTPEYLKKTLIETGFEVPFCKGINLKHFRKPLHLPSVKLINYQSIKSVLGYRYLSMLDHYFSKTNEPSRTFFRATSHAGPHLFSIVRKPMQLVP